MFYPVHHHYHLFTDFYKGLICVELRLFLTARKSDTFILWRACLLVVPAGLDSRTYSIGTLQTRPTLRTSPIPNPSRSNGMGSTPPPPDCHPIPRDGTNGTGSWDGISYIFPAFSFYSPR